METMHHTFGLEIGNADVLAMGNRELENTKEALYAHRLVIFKDQQLSRQECVTFARRLGEAELKLESYGGIDAPSAEPAGYPWQSDGAFIPFPHPLTLLHARQLPQERRQSTLFVDMHAVYEALPEDLRQQVEGRYAVHEAKWRYRVRPGDDGYRGQELLAELDLTCPPVRYPLVLSHPATGQRVLYINQGFTTSVEGLTHEEGKLLMMRLFSFAAQERFTYRHEWELGDLVVWDNRSVVYRPGEPLWPMPYGTLYRVVIDDHLMIDDSVSLNASAK